MNPYIIQKYLLQITVVECVRLKNTEWITYQDPYVCLDYGGTMYRTRVCSGGGTAPVFQEKFTFELIQGLQEIKVGVWNYHKFRSDNIIGTGKIQLQDVLARGYDDRCWTIYSESGRSAGEVRLIMNYAPPIPPYGGAPYINAGHPEVYPPPAPPPPLQGQRNGLYPQVHRPPYY